MSKTIVKFAKPSTRYNAGDVAGFDPVTAKALIDAGIAQPYVAPSTSVTALSVNTDEAMHQVREFARSEEARLHGVADGIQRKKAEFDAEMDGRERAVKEREDDVARREDDVTRREAGLDAGTANTAAGASATSTASGVIAADQVGPMPPNGATPPTGEGHEGDTPEGEAAKPEGDTKDDLPAQGTAKKGK